MPLAHVAGTLTNDHSQKNVENSELSALFRICHHSLLGLSAPPVLSPHWMEIVAPEIQPVARLMTRSRCHPVKSIVRVFSEPLVAFFLGRGGREVFGPFSPSVLYLLVF